MEGRMKNQLAKKVVVLICLFCIATCAFAQKVTLKVASIAPGRSQWDVDQRMMAQEILKATDGNVTLRFYDISTLGGEKSVIQKMRAVRPGQKAALDGAIFTSLGISELSPKSDIITLCIPFLFENDEEVSLVLKEFPSMHEALEDEGYEVLGWFSVGWAKFFTKEIAKTPSALKSLRMSVGALDSPAVGELFQMAGFNTFDIPKEKLLQSTKSSDGIQGMYSVPMYAYAAQYSKSLKYVLDVPICPVMAAFVVSKKSWEQVPAKYQKVIKDIAKRYEDKFVQVEAEMDKEYTEKMKKDGNVIVTLTSAEQKVWQDTFAKDVERIANSKSKIINYDFYQQIQKLLAEHRAKK